MHFESLLIHSGAPSSGLPEASLALHQVVTKVSRGDSASEIRGSCQRLILIAESTAS